MAITVPRAQWRRGAARRMGLRDHRHVLEESCWGPVDKELSARKSFRLFLGEHQKCGDSLISFGLFFTFAAKCISVIEISQFADGRADFLTQQSWRIRHVLEKK